MRETNNILSFKTRIGKLPYVWLNRVLLDHKQPFVYTVFLTVFMLQGHMGTLSTVIA